MLNIFSLKKPTQVQPAVKSGKRASAAQLRITKDLNELELPKTCRTEFPGKVQVQLSQVYVGYKEKGQYRIDNIDFEIKLNKSYQP